MTQFFIFALLLAGLVAILLARPLWRRSPASVQAADEREAANLAIFRDQLAELEREMAEGSLAEADFAQAKRELQRRLLEEVAPEATPASPSQAASSRKTALAIAILLPILGLLGYGVLGTPRALDPSQTQAAPQMTQAQIEGMVAKLAAKMQANPDDLQGWLMLARSYKQMGRYAEAVDAFAKAEKLMDGEPDLLAAYAETIAMARGQGLQGKPMELVKKALKLDPKHGHSLFLAGAGAMEAGDNKAGIAYWEALLLQVEPGSEIDQMLRSGVDKMKAAK